MAVCGTCTFRTMPSGTRAHWAEELFTPFPFPLPRNQHWNLQTTKGYIRFTFPTFLKTKTCPRSSVALAQLPYLSVLIAFRLRSIDHVYFYTAHWNERSLNTHILKLLPSKPDTTNALVFPAYSYGYGNHCIYCLWTVPSWAAFRNTSGRKAVLMLWSFTNI